MTEYEIGSGQMKVMRVLWKKNRATAQEIIDELNKDEIVRRSTVQTFLRVLVKKGIIDYDTEDRTFVYYPVIEKEEIVEPKKIPKPKKAKKKKKVKKVKKKKKIKKWF